MKLNDNTGEFSIPEKWVSKASVFFLPIETRPKDYPPLEKMVGRFWHVGIIHKDKIYECFNYGRKSITNFDVSKEKTLVGMKAIFIDIIVDESKLNSEIDSGTDCGEYVARVIGLSTNTGSKKQYWPEEVYDYAVKKFVVK